VLRTEERRQSKQFAIELFQNTRRMFELRRNRSWMQQCADARSAQFFRPKILEMIEWKLNGHSEGYNTIMMLYLPPSLAAGIIGSAAEDSGSYNALRLTKMNTSASSVTAAHNLANHSPCRV